MLLYEINKNETCDTSKLEPLPGVSADVSAKAVFAAVETFLRGSTVNYEVLSDQTDLRSDGSCVRGRLEIIYIN